MNICDQSEPKYNLAGPSPKIKMGASPIHGFGIFAQESIKQGELIEEARLLRLKWRSFYIHEPITFDYVWENTKCSCPTCKEFGRRVYLALGNGSLYNHSNMTNTTQKLDFVTESILIHAKVDIQAGEEIFLNYGKNYWLYRNLLKKIHPLKY